MAAHPRFDREGWRHARLESPNPAIYRRLAQALLPVSRYFRTQLDHTERVPRGAALLVGNHATYGIDSFAMFPLLYQKLGRPIRGLAEKLVFATKGSRALFHAAGVVPGTRETAQALLDQGELCLCYPGGDKDSFKRWWERHTLMWEGRSGYMRMSLATGAPVVPVLGVGIDDAFPVVGQDRLVSRRVFGSARYDLPVFLSATGLAGPAGPLAIPLPVRFHFEVFPPISPVVSQDERDAVRRGDPAAEPLVAEHHARAWAEAQANLDDLARRYDAPTRQELAARLSRWAAG